MCECVFTCAKYLLQKVDEPYANLPQFFRLLLSMFLFKIDTSHIFSICNLIKFQYEFSQKKKHTTATPIHCRRQVEIGTRRNGARAKE